MSQYGRSIEERQRLDDLQTHQTSFHFDIAISLTFNVAQWRSKALQTLTSNKGLANL